MKTRKGISPFLATIILVVITLMIGGLLYTQFRNIIVSQVKNPSMDLTDINVAPNGESIIMSIKNDGNVPITLSAFVVSYGPDHNTFKFSRVERDGGLVAVRRDDAPARGHPHGADDDQLRNPDLQHLHCDRRRGPAGACLQRAGMRRSRGISGFVASLVLVAISLSLAYVVYEGVSRLAPPKQQVFSNQALILDGTPEIEQVQVNASTATVLQALEVDDSSSHAGILYFDGTTYGSAQRLCLPGATTFFSVFTATSGILRASGNGRTWIDGQWTGSLGVAPGWHEVMFSDASSCQVTSPGGSGLSFPGGDVSTVPFIGSGPSASFGSSIPTDGLKHSLVLVFDGGFDSIA